MSQVVDHLAELTGFRDRDVLDTSLAGALRELLRPRQVAIHRCVGEEGDRRWLTRARLGAADVAATSDPLWIEVEQLPRLESIPERHAALHQQAPLSLDGTPARTLFPMVSDVDVVGVVEVETDAPLDAGQQRLVCSILRVYRNVQSLLDYSERDTLTGLLNRKTFDESFYKLIGQRSDPGQMPAERRDAALLQHFIGVIDIDHFKSVNDRFGHLIGDEVLLLLSRLMRSVFRLHDRLYRFGGEEFVVLVRCADDGDAGRAFERLRSHVEAYAFPQVGQITVSVGYTGLRPGDTPATAFERADKAVYWAKSHGRNQVCSHAALAARGDEGDDTKVGDVELF